MTSRNQKKNISLHLEDVFVSIENEENEDLNNFSYNNKNRYQSIDLNSKNNLNFNRNTILDDKLDCSIDLNEENLDFNSSRVSKFSGSSMLSPMTNKNKNNYYLNNHLSNSYSNDKSVREKINSSLYLPNIDNIKINNNEFSNSNLIKNAGFISPSVNISNKNNRKFINNSVNNKKVKDHLIDKIWNLSLPFQVNNSISKNLLRKKKEREEDNFSDEENFNLNKLQKEIKNKNELQEKLKSLKSGLSEIKSNLSLKNKINNEENNVIKKNENKSRNNKINQNISVVSIISDIEEKEEENIINNNLNNIINNNVDKNIIQNSELEIRIKNLELKLKSITDKKEEIQIVPKNDNNLILKLFGATMKLILQLDDTINSKLEEKCERCDNNEKYNLKFSKSITREENKNEILSDNLQSEPNSFMSNNLSNENIFMPSGNWNDFMNPEIINQLSTDNSQNKISSSIQNIKNQINHSPRYFSLVKKNKIICYKCGKANHKKINCPSNKIQN